MDKSKAEKELRRRAELYSKAIAEIEEMTDDDLVALLELCRSRTNTNCWWPEYQIVRPLESSITSEQARRARNTNG